MQILRKPTTLVVAILLVGGAAVAKPVAVRWFADRDVAWSEDDQQDVAKPPEANRLQELGLALTVRDHPANEADRIAGEGAVPAEDVNAFDEVPCSSWYCPRNQLYPVGLDEIAAGASADPPVLPFRIMKGRDEGRDEGSEGGDEATVDRFPVLDAKGHKFMLKLDIKGHLGLPSSGDMIGYRLFHAAGYHVPGAFLIDFDPADLHPSPPAAFERFAGQPVGIAHLPDGRIRGVAVPWVEGRVLGSFDMRGRRVGDPNDRIPHENRRSLRATWVLFAWLSVIDPGAFNTLDSYVEENGRHFVRHYLFDFGGSFDASFGASIGSPVTFPETFDPDTTPTNRRVAAHQRMTSRDAYWGAKVVTSFSDAQLHAVVATAGLPEPDGFTLERVLRVRRDILGRRYLRAEAAVETPATSYDGDKVCFDDLAIKRGYVAAPEARYLIEVSDGYSRTLDTFEHAPSSWHTCLPFGGPGPGTGYRVVSIRERLTGGAGRPEKLIGKAARIHLRWHGDDARFEVVGLERDE